MGSKCRMLNRIAPPTAYARASSAAMQTIARLPTAPASSGAQTRKPLPMIDANGVTVAFHADEPASRFESARYAASATAVPTINPFSTRPLLAIAGF